MDMIITSQGLSRAFGARRVVDGLDLQVRTGTITGFLGPNGAGKTTTISLLLGLLKPSAGTAEVLGRPPGHPEALARLGAMVESPSLYDHLTGLENLEITRIMRDVPRSDLDRVLGLVDLSRDGRRPVREYSLGMRQRLGVALALLGEPQLLILDEPTNGLDPAGIQDMRELIRRMPAETGASIFLSSHLLAEMEQVAQDVVVIHRGRIRYQGPMEGLGGGAPEVLMLRVNDEARAIEVLGSRGLVAVPVGTYLQLEVPSSEAPRIATDLVQAGLALYELTPKKASLEARFLAITEGGE